MSLGEISVGKDIYSRVKYPKGQRSVGQVRMGTDVRGIGVKRESTHVASKISGPFDTM